MSGGDLWLFASVEAASMTTSLNLYHTLSITQHVFMLSPKLLGLISTPTRRFRPKSISCSNNNNSNLVSASECWDGSVLFRFGDSAETLETESSSCSSESLNDDKGDEANSNSVTVQNSLETCDVSGSIPDSGEVLSIDESVKVRNKSAFEVDLERNDKNQVINFSVDSKLVLDKFCASSEVGEVTAQFPSSGSELGYNSPNSYANEKVQVMQVSTDAKEQQNADLVPTYGAGEDVVVGNVIEGMPKSDSTEADSDAATHTTVISGVEEETTEDDAVCGNTIKMSVSDAVIELVGPTSERMEMPTLTAELFLSSGAALLQCPFKALAGGGDAYFVACQNWLGIADGVGQWSLEGTKAGLYAQELMENCENIVSESENAPITDPVGVLSRSVAKTQSPGLSTVLVAYFDGQALHVANIGDSGFLIIRHGTIFKRSSPMVHEFSFPLQITRGDNPSELVEVQKIDLIEGDVIVMGTDGLFDNLFEQEIFSVVSRSLQDGFKVQEIAESLAVRAQEVGQSVSARSPFADAAQAAGYVGYNGGKLDDVTVIVSLVDKRSDSHL